MRSRVRQCQLFQWARPTVTETDGELLRAWTYDRWVSGAAYPLPDTQARRADGLQPGGGLLLILPPDCGLAVGDRLREYGAPERTCEITETRRYPGHMEAVARRPGAEPFTQEAEQDDG